MITKLTLELSDESKAPDRFDYNISSAMQGMLMEFVTPEYGDFLHQNQVHPYSQFIHKEGEHMFWTVTMLTDEARMNILDRINAKEVEVFQLKHKNRKLLIVNKTVDEISEQQLMNNYYFSNKTRYIKIHFTTPVSFKQNGQYCLFPSVRLIFQSLMNKYDANSKNSMFDEEVLTHYEKYAHISDYRLRSTTFSLEGTRIPAFIGDITLKITGPQQLVNLAWMLTVYGEYSGVGIKTAMGMGAMQVTNKTEGARKYE